MQKRRNKTAQRNITLNQGENQYLPAVKPVKTVNCKPAQKTEKPEGQSPLSFTAFLSEELFQKLNAFGIHLIQEDEITLKPYLLKDQK